MPGGCDSFNMLVPHSECVGGGDDGPDLSEQYQTVRSDVAISKSELLQIDVEGQDCGKFGLNPGMTILKNLYNDGDASFFANIGALVEPMNKAEYKSGEKAKPRNLFAHNSQQTHAQTIEPQATAATGILGKIKDALTHYMPDGQKKRVNTYR